MQFIHFTQKKIMLALMMFFAISSTIAQTKPTDATTTTSGNNQLATLLIIITIVLAFVIWGIGQVLVILSKQLLEKNKNLTKIIVSIITVGFLLAPSQSFAQATAAKDGVIELPNYGGLSATTFYFFVIVILIEVTAILFLAFSIRRVYSELLPAKDLAVEKKSKLKIWWANIDKKIFTKAVPVEKEADVMLDHDYDGIRELDNALPPWWKYGFYITIAVACIYLLNFHVLGNGKNPTEEYVQEMENARIEKEIFDANNKDKIDEKNVPMADASGLAFAKGIFLTKCKVCHGEQGQGLQGLGPNLTDDYWLHKGSLNDIYNTIKNGYADKGMQSWANDYTPKEISFLASYVKSLRGTNPPNAKAPQGDLYTESLTAPTVADSSKKIKPDSATKK